MTNQVDLRVDIAGVTLKNPITTPSGTFSPREFSQFMDLSELGGVIVKGISSVPWKGNPIPRVAETYGGMLNAVGLQNPGGDYFIKNDLPFLKQFDTKIIINIAGHTIEEYCEVVEKLADTSIHLLELNISCPNIKEGGIGFGTSVEMAEKVTRAVKRVAAEDVITIGGSVKEVMEVVKELGSEVVGVAVLVDRSNGTIDFGVKLDTALTVEVQSWDSETCPICEKGEVELAKPGSRTLKV